MSKYPKPERSDSRRHALAVPLRAARGLIERLNDQGERGDTAGAVATTAELRAVRKALDAHDERDAVKAIDRALGTAPAPATRSSAPAPQRLSSEAAMFAHSGGDYYVESTPLG